ncbi:MAG: restriction endonuclease [Rhodothermales bacterium]|nr:restriction endonuclease [Rhodothermales bacterium]
MSTQIPTYKSMIDPLLRLLASRDGPVKTADVYAGIAEMVGMTAEDKRELLPSGTQPVYINRIGWAQDALKRSGLADAPRRGHWKITNDGKLLLEKHGGRVPEFVAHDIALRNRNTPLVDLSQPHQPTGPTPPDTDQNEKSPEEKIEEGLQEIRASVSRQIHEYVMKATPEFFEQLVLDLLLAMGYGANRDSLQRVGGSGDGGIDGIISLDKLGLEKVYIQAKRWKGSVGSPEIQGFVGALQLNGANKGVFITSGMVSRPAVDSARRANMVLIDGERLASLMIEHEVGVSSMIRKIPQLDSDYFEE